ncbi:MAG: FAD-binding dehydrogenase [Terriglobia bacterium]|nr:MAG: FAD-binding dehydrogenase [Terriglobia bacterium]
MPWPNACWPRLSPLATISGIIRPLLQTGGAVMNRRNSVNRRDFFKGAAALGAAATASAAQRRFDHSADVVIVGAGAAGLPAAISARDHGASVLVIDENHDIGGHAMLSGGRIPLGGGHSLQKKYGIADSADQVYLDHTNHRNPEFRYADRDLVRAWANENVATFEFLLENGVVFEDAAPTVVNGGSVPRLFVTKRFSDDYKETINGRPGSGLVRHLEAKARAKGVTFLLRHKLTGLLRENPKSGRVLGIAAQLEGKDVNIQAKKGVILATGGHTSNVEFRRMFDPRLTEEYQVTGEPWSKQNADGEILAMAIGASLWATANQPNEGGRAVTKTLHIGCRWGYQNLKWEPESPIFAQAGASGLTVRSFEDVILVNQVGRRFWNELDDSYRFLAACLGTNGNLGNHGKANGGGPIWAIFDSEAAKREGWDPRPPNVDPNGWFFGGETIGELAAKIKNPYQLAPIPAHGLEETVARYNAFVDAGKDTDFGRPSPKFKIQAAPFYAAWSTPILHDTLTGLKINGKCQVIDVHGRVIPGLFCAGETAGGFGLHGLPRATVFGRIAGREAASEKV